MWLDIIVDLTISPGSLERPGVYIQKPTQLSSLRYWITSIQLGHASVISERVAIPDFAPVREPLEHPKNARSLWGKFSYQYQGAIFFQC